MVGTALTNRSLPFLASQGRAKRGLL